MHSVESNFDLSDIIEAIKQLEDSGKFDFNCNSLQSLIDQLAAIGYNKDTVTNQLSGIISDLAGELDVGTGFSDIPLANIFTSSDIAEFDDLPTLADASSDLYDIAGGTGKTKMYFDHHPKMATGGKVVGGLVAASFTGLIIYAYKNNKTNAERALAAKEQQKAENFEKLMRGDKAVEIAADHVWWGARRDVKDIWKDCERDAREFTSNMINKSVEIFDKDDKLKDNIPIEEYWSSAKKLGEKPLLNISKKSVEAVKLRLKTELVDQYTEMRKSLVNNNPNLFKALKADKQAFLKNEVGRTIESLKADAQAAGRDLTELEKKAILQLGKLAINDVDLRLGRKVFLKRPTDTLFDKKTSEILQNLNKYDGDALKKVNTHFLKEDEVDLLGDFLTDQIDSAIEDNLKIAEICMTAAGNPQSLNELLMHDVKGDIRSLVGVEAEKLSRDVDAFIVKDAKNLEADIVEDEFSRVLRDVRLNVVQMVESDAQDLLRDLKSDVKIEIESDLGELE